MFLDSSGRRRRLLLCVAYALSGLCFLYGALVSISLAVGPSKPHLVEPVPEAWPGPRLSWPAPTPERVGETRRVSHQEYAPAPWPDRADSGAAGDPEGSWPWLHHTAPARQSGWIPGWPDTGWPAPCPTTPTPTPTPTQTTTPRWPARRPAPDAAPRRIRELPLGRSGPAERAGAAQRREPGQRSPSAKPTPSPGAPRVSTTPSSGAPRVSTTPSSGQRSRGRTGGSPPPAVDPTPSTPPAGSPAGSAEPTLEPTSTGSPAGAAEPTSTGSPAGAAEPTASSPERPETASVERAGPPEPRASHPAA